LIKLRDVNQDIQPHQMRYSPNYVYWTYLLKSIKDKSLT
jgi:hypothetical protein